MHSDKLLFDFAIDNGMIDTAKLVSEYERMQKIEYLKKHYGEEFSIDQLKPGNDHRYFTRLPDGKQIRKTNIDDFIDAVVAYYKDEVIVEDGIQQVFKEWIEFKEKYDKISPGTINRYASDFERFFINNPYSEDLMKVPLCNILEDSLEYFIRDTINFYNLDTKGWLKLKALIKGIWLYGLKIKKTNLYITKFLDTLMISNKALAQKEEQNERQVFTDEEVLSIFSFIDSQPFSMVSQGIKLAFFTGMRAGEIAALRWRDIADDFSSIKVQSEEITYKDSEGKRHFEVVAHAKTKAGLRTILLPQDAITFLKELYASSSENEFVFVNAKRIQGRVFSDKLSKICHQLGIPPRRLHKARKTVCSKLCDAQVDDRLLLEQVGHTDRKTTELFYHRDRRPEAEKLDIINEALTYHSSRNVLQDKKIVPQETLKHYSVAKCRKIHHILPKMSQG